MHDRNPRAPRKSPLVFVNIIAIGILVLAVASSGGIFLFKTYTEQSIVSKRQSLDRQRAAFEPATIEELLRLDKRINASGGLLKAHTALTILFDDLETRTGENVRFKNFKFESSGQGKFSISMGGSAQSFNSVALQSDSFGKSAIVKDPIFTNLNLDQNGEVVFDFSAIIDPARINYATLVAGLAGAGSVVPVNEEPAP